MWAKVQVPYHIPPGCPHTPLPHLGGVKLFYLLFSIFLAYTERIYKLSATGLTPYDSPANGNYYLYWLLLVAGIYVGVLCPKVTHYERFFGF